MKITEIRIHLMGEERLKAFASVTFDDSFVVRNMKIVEGAKGVFLCMPSRKLPDGTHKDMVHPINQEFRKYLEDNILKAYQDELAKTPSGITKGPIEDNPSCEECIKQGSKQHGSTAAKQSST